MHLTQGYYCTSIQAHFGTCHSLFGKSFIRSLKSELSDSHWYSTPPASSLNWIRRKRKIYIFQITNPEKLSNVLDIQIMHELISHQKKCKTNIFHVLSCHIHTVGLASLNYMFRTGNWISQYWSIASVRVSKNIFLIHTTAV